MNRKYINFLFYLKILRDKNLISMTEKGLYVLMPFVVKSMEKLIQIIDNEMIQINGQKLVMPSLITKKLWDISGLMIRFNKKTLNLFSLFISKAGGLNREKNSFG